MIFLDVDFQERKISQSNFSRHPIIPRPAYRLAPDQSSAVQDSEDEVYNALQRSIVAASEQNADAMQARERRWREQQLQRLKRATHSHHNHTKGYGIFGGRGTAAAVSGTRSRTRDSHSIEISEYLISSLMFNTHHKPFRSEFQGCIYLVSRKNVKNALSFFICYASC
jgi:hypothetical protein